MSDIERPDLGLGKAIELRRIELGLKRRELAERARLSYPYISEIENGVKEPSAKALRQIAEALDMKVATLAALTERLEEGSAGSVLLSSVEAQPPAAVLPTPERRYVSGADVVGDRRVLHLEARPEPAEPFGEAVRAAVSREIDTWLREVLPVIVRAEVERQLAERDRSRSGDEGS